MAKTFGRFLSTAALLWVLPSISLAQALQPPCITDSAQLPQSWRSAPKVQKTLSPAPWSAAEARAAKHAKIKGIEEIIEFFEREPVAVSALYDDSVEMLLQATHASRNAPALDEKIRQAARANLSALIAGIPDYSDESPVCYDFVELLPLALFAQRLFPDAHQPARLITQRTNEAYRDCGSIDAATNEILRRAIIPPERLLKLRRQERSAELQHLEHLFDLTLWVIWLTEARLFPAIELSPDAQDFIARGWAYLSTFPLRGTQAFADGPRDQRFLVHADLAAHIAHVPTGIHRFALRVDDAPVLHDYVREQFYALMQSGDVDLIASFVDTLRQYGCTPGNDVQVRDGMRYLLKVFQAGEERWIVDDKKGKPPAAPSLYDRLHRPWTAVLGIRNRQLRSPKPDTYGAVFRDALRQPR